MRVRPDSEPSHGPLDASRAPDARSARVNRQPSTALCRVLADNVIRLRAARGLTQLQLAARSGLTNAYISKVEQGNRNIGLGCLEALAAGLDCWPADLLIPLASLAPAAPDPTREGPV